MVEAGSAVPVNVRDVEFVIPSPFDDPESDPGARSGADGAGGGSRGGTRWRVTVDPSSTSMPSPGSVRETSPGTQSGLSLGSSAPRSTFRLRSVSWDVATSEGRHSTLGTATLAGGVGPVDTISVMVAPSAACFGS